MSWLDTISSQGFTASPDMLIVYTSKLTNNTPDYYPYLFGWWSEESLIPLPGQRNRTWTHSGDVHPSMNSSCNQRHGGALGIYRQCLDGVLKIFMVLVGQKHPPVAGPCSETPKSLQCHSSRATFPIPSRDPNLSRKPAKTLRETAIGD